MWKEVFMFFFFPWVLSWLLSRGTWILVRLACGGGGGVD
jgi:hypothetical protein